MLALARRIAADASLAPGEWAIDVGGGYGDHAAQWQALRLRAVVADPSAAMRRVAATRADVVVVGARGERLPFASHSIGLYYAHLSIHYCDAPAALREAMRVIRPGGSIAVGTLGPRHHRASFLSRWFPSIAPNDEARFPAPSGLAEQLVEGGATVHLEQVDIAKRRSAAAWRSAVVGGFVSSLQFVSEAELAAGLAAFDVAFPDPEQLIDYVIRYDWVHATV